MKMLLIAVLNLAVTFVACSRLVDFLRNRDWMDLGIAAGYGMAAIFGFMILWREGCVAVQT